MAQPVIQSPSPGHSADAQLVSLKVPPHSVEAEQSVLGGLLLDNGAWDRIADVVAARRLLPRRPPPHLPAHREADRDRASRPTWSRSPSRSSAARTRTRPAGSPTSARSRRTRRARANIRRYAEIVRERAVMRKLAEVGTEIADSAFNPAGKEVGQLLDEAESKIFQIAEAGAPAPAGLPRDPPAALAGDRAHRPALQPRQPERRHRRADRLSSTSTA